MGNAPVSPTYPESDKLSDVLLWSPCSLKLCWMVRLAYFSSIAGCQRDQEAVLQKLGKQCAGQSVEPPVKSVFSHC